MSLSACVKKLFVSLVVVALMLSSLVDVLNCWKTAASDPLCRLNNSCRTNGVSLGSGHCFGVPQGTSYLKLRTTLTALSRQGGRGVLMIPLKYTISVFVFCMLMLRLLALHQVSRCSVFNLYAVLLLWAISLTSCVLCNHDCGCSKMYSRGLRTHP